jgi:uncharacterized membrane protein YdjX (TVP38/TMEM64 family)
MKRDQSPASVAARGAMKPLLMAGGMIAIATALPLLGAGSAQGALSQMVAEGGVRGPAMFLVLATFLTAIGLPRQIPCFVAGFAFGPWYGTVIALVAQVLACSLDFIWARALGRDFVRHRFGARLRRVDRMLDSQPFITVLTLRLLPVGSNILLNLAAGLSSVRVLPFLAASALGFIPQTVIFAMFGQGAAPSHLHMLLIGGGLFAVSAVVGMLMFRRQQRLDATALKA